MNSSHLAVIAQVRRHYHQWICCSTVADMMVSPPLPAGEFNVANAHIAGPEGGPAVLDITGPAVAASVVTGRAAAVPHTASEVDLGRPATRRKIALEAEVRCVLEKGTAS